MARVRGSKQETLVVQAHRPWRRMLSLLLFVLLLAVAFLLGYWLAAGHEVGRSAEVVGQSQELKATKKKLLAMERSSKLDQLAVETSRQNIEVLTKEIAQLKKTVSFYRSILEPEVSNEGLQVHELDIAPVAQEHYRLSWVLAQMGKAKGLLQGACRVNLIGYMDGLRKTLALNNLTQKPFEGAFKFRYFQNFEVFVTLPKGFSVTDVEIIAETQGKNKESVSRQFQWLAQENEVNVE